MKRTDLVPLAILGLAGLAFAYARGDGALAHGLALIAITVMVAAHVGSELPDFNHGIGGPTLTQRQQFLTTIAAGVVGIVLILVQFARIGASPS